MQQATVVSRSPVSNSSATVSDEKFDAETRLPADQGLELAYDPFVAVQKKFQSGCSVKILRAPSKGKATVDPTNGQIRYTSDSGYVGPDSLVSLLSCDNLSKKIRLTLDVKHINHQPQVEDLSMSSDEDTGTEADLKGSDVDMDQLAYIIVTRPAKGTIDERKFLMGKLVYTPPENFNGEVTFTYGATDGFWQSTTKTIKITVIPVKDRPVAYDATLNTAEDTPVNGKLLGTSVDDQKLTFVLLDAPSTGQISNFNETTGEYTYTPKLNFNGDNSFAYQVVIAGDGEYDRINRSDARLVTIRIAAVNDPVATEDRAWKVDEDKTLSGSIPSVNPDGDKLTFQIVQAPTHGTLLFTDPLKGDFTYKPDNDYNGQDHFVASVSDGSSAASSRNTITVDAVNDPPIAREASFTIDENSSLQNRMSGSDLENDPLTWVICQSPRKGTVAITNRSTGEFTYTPAADFNGTDSFLYKVSDSSLSSECVPITVVVRSVTSPRIAVFLKTIEFGAMYRCPAMTDGRLLMPMALATNFSEADGYLQRATKDGNLDVNVKYQLPPGISKPAHVAAFPDGSSLAWEFGGYDQSWSRLIRIMSSGIFDSSFGVGGVISVPRDIGYIPLVVPVEDGFYLLYNDRPCQTRVRKMTRDGKSLQSFCIGGYDPSAGIQGSKVIMHGRSQGSERQIHRYNGDGTVDQEFKWDVEQPPWDSSVTDLSIDRSGRILVTGVLYYSGTSYVSRYEKDGTPDNTFGDAGIIKFSGVTSPETIRELPDGKIFVGGTSDLAILNSTGELFSDFSNGGVFVTGRVQSSGNIVSLVCPTSESSFVNFDKYYGANGELSTYRIIDPSKDKLSRISVTAPVQIAKVGVKVALTASGVYGDAAETNLSQQAIWSSSNTSVANVDQTGLVTPLKAGQTVITATVADGVSASLTLPVEEPKVLSLSFNPSKITVRPGDQASFTVSAIYEGGNTVDVTAGANFTASNPSRVSVGPGFVQGSGSGTTTVSASFGGKSASLTIDVLAVTALEMSLPPPGADMIQGNAIQARVTAKYSDNTSQDVTSKVSWFSSLTSVATVTPAGLISGVSLGSASVQASLGGTFVEKSIRVTEFTHLAFVTSVPFRASFGGVQGADAECARSASAAGLTGSWKAILSSTTENAKDRLTIRGKVKKINGDVIFNSADEMWSSATVMIDQTELGGTLNGVTGAPRVWSATAPDGQRSGGTCRDWISTSFSAGFAAAGTPTSFRPGEWIRTEGATLLCEERGYLYCISQ